MTITSINAVNSITEPIRAVPVQIRVRFMDVHLFSNLSTRMPDAGSRFFNESFAGNSAARSNFFAALSS